VIANFGMRISDCKSRIEASHVVRSDFGYRAKVLSKQFSNLFSSHVSIDSKSTLRNLKSAILLGTMLFALCVPAWAQLPTKVQRIGFLGATSLSGESARIEAF